MILGIMQPYFFPYIGYYQVIEAVDKYVLYDNLSFSKETWINRNRLLAKNGSPFYMVVPIVGKRSAHQIRDVRIADQKPWRRKLLASLHYHYKKAPFFDETYSIVERTIHLPTDSLAELNAHSIISIAGHLDIPTTITSSSHEYDDLEDKLADESNYVTLFPHFTSMPIRKVLRILEVCRIEKATQFVNAPGGQTLYSRAEFAAQGVDLKFVNPLEYVYQQHGTAFFRDLSIVDVLMNCGKARTSDLVRSYKLS